MQKQYFMVTLSEKKPCCKNGLVTRVISTTPAEFMLSVVGKGTIYNIIYSEEITQKTYLRFYSEWRK